MPKARYKVIGPPAGIVGDDGQDVRPPGTVELDDTPDPVSGTPKVNVRALAEAGHIVPLEDPPEPAGDQAPGEKADGEKAADQPAAASGRTTKPRS